jgi:hypothetical protein
MKPQRKIKTPSKTFKPVKALELLNRLKLLPGSADIRLTGNIMGDVFIDRALNHNSLNVYYDDVSDDVIIHIG